MNLLWHILISWVSSLKYLSLDMSVRVYVP